MRKNERPMKNCFPIASCYESWKKRKNLDLKASWHNWEKIPRAEGAIFPEKYKYSVTWRLKTVFTNLSEGREMVDVLKNIVYFRFFFLVLVVLLIIFEVWRYISKPSVERLWNENLLICYKPITWCCAVLSRFSHVLLFVTLWNTAHQAPLSMGFCRHEYWSG